MDLNPLHLLAYYLPGIVLAVAVAVGSVLALAALVLVVQWWMDRAEAADPSEPPDEGLVILRERPPPRGPQDPPVTPEGR